ncbi:Unconventional myosin-IXAb [Labeo rohita]|uniref:Unconventional myosin-IXAb n=1 Tax=Labeo rohita TaxID=84645 RepID=A0ABQ8LG77_LABRO|nr:Unconventional myosin-IXAb [Labeo rohita]
MCLCFFVFPPQAFGNAKTAHNNNSSRFGKFIQVNYQESGTVRGAYVEKYLLEKSRLVYQEHNERNYHVFYYLLAGASEEERKAFHLLKPEEYHYLNQNLPCNPWQHKELDDAEAVAGCRCCHGDSRQHQQRRDRSEQTAGRVRLIQSQSINTQTHQRHICCVCVIDSVSNIRVCVRQMSISAALNCLSAFQITKKVHRQHWGNYCETELDCFMVEGEDLKHDFERLQLAMEMVGFLPTTRKQIFSLLSAILLLGNIRYKKKTYRDDSIDICNPEVLPIVSELLEVKEEMLFEALTTRKTVTVGERLIVPYKLAEAGTVRDSMAKSLYGALFDWIVFRTNHALLYNKDLEDSDKILSIGVLDIFGFEDYENNSFEQFCINFANETLQHYFNQHVFKLEQEEYRSEGISWHMIDYIDNTACINLISKKPTALLHLLDEECNFPQASNQTLLDKFKRQHEGNGYIEFPAVMEPAFIIRHYAGKVKYSVKDFREKNTDHMRPDIVALLKSSRNAFICGLMGIDPVATFRWAVIRAYFRALVAFREAGKRHKEKKATSSSDGPVQNQKNSCISRRSPRTPLSDLQGTNTLSDKISRRCERVSSFSSHEEEGIFVNSVNNKLLERAQGILMRNKNYKAKPSLPKHLLDVKSLKYLSCLTLHDRITKSLLHLHKKKKPPSISAQFNVSLNKLMETLGQSEPYFVKCIRSNAEKLPLRFNDALVLRQLRYTGMLETTGIRQFLQSVDPEPNGHQVGRSTVFLQERLRQRLQEQLHQEVLRRIVCLQRSFRTQQERRRFCTQRRAARLIQGWWRDCLNRADVGDAELQQGAALRLQTAWRGFRERRLYLRQRRAALIIQTGWRRVLQARHAAAILIQAVWKSYRQRRSFLQQRRAARRGEKILCENTVSKSLHAHQNLTEVPDAQDEKLETQSPEPPKTVDDSTLRSRSKRESRRQRELQQATFSLELLKVRSGSMDDALPAQIPLSKHLPSDSQESFEVLSFPDEEPAASELRPQSKSEPMEEENRSSPASFKPHFYIADDDGSPVRPVREKKESVVVIISMQKENPVDQSSLEALQKLEMMDAEEIRPETADRLNGLSSSDRPDDKTTPSPEPQTDRGPIAPSSKPLQLDLRDPVLEATSEPKKEVQKKFVSQSISISMKEKAFPPKRSRLTFSNSFDVINVNDQVSRAARKKKARMAGTRSDFLSRACSTEIDSDDDEDDEYEYRAVLSRTLPLPESPSSPDSDPACHSDSQTLSQKEQKRIQKTMSSGDLGKMDSLRKSISQTDGRVRGKMRFWSKSKHGDKKMSTRGRSADSELTDRRNDSPPGSPENTGLSERGRDSKENREPMMGMMSMKRRRSVKISSISLESSAWQNDSLHILTSTADYRSMNDFLMKKISDLEAEDSQKDTPVDVVFKKALKEFRLNIFNSYSTALAMDDGRSIRYKDLHALFEHILEKNMRLEQRDWSESPVKVWVNTFKVFLDEFMTEYKPMDGTISKAPKPERKKRRKKESDTVEEHMGHIFKSTQYSIPTYCEFCSSLIWMMDKACVCKLCRYACHRKCCLRMTTTCSKKFDPELSSRQFGVELSRLTSDERAVPLVVEKLINYIEMHGLYTEGIYRKSGSTNKIKELKQGLDTDANSVNLDDYNIHDKREVVQGVYSVIDQLSRTHLSTLERLIFHLVRISFQEETNRMSANALAIVFAPCILRCPDTTDPLQSVRDISKTTACFSRLILSLIHGKCPTSSCPISVFRHSTNPVFFPSLLPCPLLPILLFQKPVLIAGKARLRKSGRHTPSPPLSPRAAEREEPGDEGAESGLSEQQQAAMQQEEKVLTEQIENLQKENRRGLRRQPESLDSVDSAVASLSSVSSTPHYRFRSSSSGPLFSSSSPGGDLHILPDQEGSEQASLTNRCASSSEKTRPRPRGNRSCPPKSREPGEGGGSAGGRRREHEFGSSQPLVLYGSNEFMV